MQNMSIETVKKLNQNNGFHFFSSGAMKFFDTELNEKVFVSKNKLKAFFTTSEQFDEHSSRRHTVRVCNLKTGDVETVGKFQEFFNEPQALKHALNLSKRVVK